MKTIKEVLGCLSMAALAIVLAAPVSAQTLALRASMPFDFVVGGRIVPTSAVTNAVYGQRDGAAFLTFHRYGGDYFLAAIWDGAGSGGRSIPISSTEKEKSQSASMAKPDVATVLARR